MLISFGSNLLFNLTDGGTAGIFWGYTLVIIACIFIYLSIMEMSSMSPTAGGQYHWVSEYAPPWCQKYLSYITGWVIAMGWQGSVVGLSFSAGTIIQVSADDLDSIEIRDAKNVP